MRKGNLKTKLLSMLLVAVMVITSITVWPAKEEVRAASDYEELTFIDFGLEDGVYGQGNLKRNTSLTSLDGVALVGDLILIGDGDHRGLSLEAGNGGWTTFQIYRVGTTVYLRHWGASGMPETHFDASELGVTDFTTTKIRTRICFDKASDTSVVATMTMTVGDKSVTKTLTMEGVADMVYSASGYRIGTGEDGAASVGFYSVEPESHTITFKDLGITEGNYAGTYAHGELPSDIESWDNVTVEGYVTMPSNDSGAYIGWAGTEQIASGLKYFANTSEEVWFWNDLTGNNHVGIPSGKTDDAGNVLGAVTGESIKMSVTFKYVDNDLNMILVINDTWTLDWTFGDTVDAIGRRVVVSGNVTVADVVEEEPKEDENKTYTFSDFGIAEGNYAGTYVHGTLPEDVTSWDGISLVGEIIMPKNDDGSYIGIAGTEEKVSGIKLFGANGNQLWFWNDLTSKNHLGITEGQQDENGNVLGTVQGEKMKVQFDFALADGDVQMRFTVNDTWIYDWTFGETASALGNLLVISGNVTVYDVKENEEEAESKEYTFSDFGITEGNYAGTYVHGTLPEGVTSWDGISLVGEIIMPKNDDGSYIGIAGTEEKVSGIKLFGANGNQLWFWNDLTSKNHLGITEGQQDANGNVLGTVQGEKLKVRFDFELVDSDVQMRFTVNDTWIYDWTFGETASALGNLLVISGNVTVYDVKEDEEEPENPPVYEEPEYTELTFADLGIKDANYNGGYATGTLPEGITSFDEVAITGIVTLPADSDSPYIGFAGTEDMPSGVKMFGAYGNSLWMWNDLTGKNHLGVSEGDLDESGNVLGTLLGEPLKIWVGFDFVDNDVHMKLVLGDVWSHSWIIEDSADAFGTNVTVSGDVTIGEPKVYEYTEVSFDDFGIAGQQLSGETVVSGKTPAESMNLLKFVGYVTFPDGRDNGHISIAGKDGNNGIAVFWQSDNIWFWDETGASMGCIDAFKPEELGYESFAGRELKVAIAFAYDETDAFITMTLDDQVEKSKLLAGYTEWLGTEIKCVAGSNATITYRSSLTETIKKPVVNETPLRELSKYETVTFIEMGLDDETVRGYGREDKSKIDTLDGKVFQGFVTFPADGQGIIRIGGTIENRWYGIHVEASDGGLRLFEAANGKQAWNIGSDVIGKDIAGENIKLALTFTKVDDHNVYVGVYVDDKFCGEKLFENLEQPFGAGLLVYSEEAGITIASVETAWQRFLKSKVNLAYFGFTDNWRQELADICR